MLRKPLARFSPSCFAERLPHTGQVVASFLESAGPPGQGYAYRSSVGSPLTAYAKRSNLQELAPFQSG